MLHRMATAYLDHNVISILDGLEWKFSMRGPNRNTIYYGWPRDKVDTS